MILSKSNLLVSLVAAVQKIPLLNNIFIRKDGTTIASNGKVLIAVSPTHDKLRESYPIKDGMVDEDFLIGCESVGQILKDLPRDIQFNGILEQCSVKLFESDVNFKITNGRFIKESNVKRLRIKWIDYKNIISRVFKRKSSIKIVLNKNRLLNLLQALDKICPDSSSFSPIYIEFTEGNDIILRCIHPKTKQRAIGFMTSYKTKEGTWLPSNVWERSLENDFNENRIDTIRRHRDSRNIVRHMDVNNGKPRIKRTKIKRVKKIK